MIFIKITSYDCPDLQIAQDYYGKTSSLSIIHLMAYQFQVSIGLLFALILSSVTSQEYHVSPNCPTISPVECHDVSFYAQTSTSFFTNGSTFIFSSGIHTLYHSLVINGVNGLSLIGDGETVGTGVRITCSKANVSLFIYDSTNVSIRGLTITDCGSNEYINILGYGRQELEPAALIIIETYTLSIRDSFIQNNTGLGLLLLNGFNALIQNSFIVNNKVHGNAFVYYTNPNRCLTRNESQIYQLIVTDSSFSFGSGAAFGSGLTILIDHDCTYRVDVKLIRIKSCNNSGDLGGNIVIHTSNIEYYSILVDSVESHGGMGGGMAISITYDSVLRGTCPCNYPPPMQVTRPLEIRNSSFYKNVAIFGAGLIVQTQPSDFVVVAQEIYIHSCQFYDNIGYAGSGLYITEVELSSSNNPLSFSLIDLNISRNVLVNPGPSCAMFLYGIRIANVKGLTIYGNNDTGLLLYNSLVMFDGSILIYNNTANEGAGMALYGNSIMVINNGTDMCFYNNRAVKIGGGIYIKSSSPFLEVCRIQIAYLTYTTLPNSQILFVNNTAGIAGSAIYGGILDQCQNLLSTSIPRIPPSQLYQVININKQEGLSVISSDAVSLCFCDNGLPSCTNQVKYKSFEAYPGDDINVALVAIGQTQGLTQGLISITSSVDTQRYVIETPSNCSNINHTVLLFNDTTTPTNVTVSVGIIDTQQPLVPPVQILAVIITVLPCPPGFSLSIDTGVCKCSLELEQDSVTCNITTNTLEREGNQWIGYQENEGCIIIYNDCPFNYCNNSRVAFNISSPNAQCVDNRSGLLCGGCDEGLSLMLGYSQCGQCTNDYLSLIIPFAAAGIALVILLLALNLTVSVGTINGLVFYANIIKINETYLFPGGPIPILSQFISWLNLDLGISACFFNGMDAYSNMWLQFAFPFYIWTIIGAIICACHFSNRLSKLIGSNVVPVLATLSLLSYTKLISTILLILDLVVIKCDSNISYHWGLDPNLAYFSKLHLILFLFALLVLFCLVFPYVLLLLLNPLIGGKLSRFTCCKFCSKLKPFFDAYFGPLKDSYRWWVGVLLLARLVLLGISFSNQSNTFTLTISLSAVLIAVEASVGGMYQHKFLNILEIWFLLLIVLHSTIANNGYGYIGGIVITTLAFVTFVGIIIYHVYQRNNKTILKLWRKIKEPKRLRGSTLSDQLISNEYDVINKDHVTKSVVDTNRRESLLFDMASDNYDDRLIN